VGQRSALAPGRAPATGGETGFPSIGPPTVGRSCTIWDLETKRLILRKGYEALPVGGALIVYGGLIDDGRRSNAFVLSMSVNMLIETTGGFDYPGADCQGWMREVGLRETRVEQLAGTDSMVIGIK